MTTDDTTVTSTTVLPSGPPTSHQKSPLSRPMLVGFVVVTLLVVSGAYLLLTKEPTASPRVAHVLTHAQLVAQAEAICTTLNADLAKLPAPTARSGAHAAAALDKQLAVARGGAKQLRALAPPAKDVTAWTSAMAGINRMLVATQGVSTALRNGTPPQAKLATVERETKAVNATFTKLGMPICAS